MLLTLVCFVFSEVHFKSYWRHQSVLGQTFPVSSSCQGHTVFGPHSNIMRRSTFILPFSCHVWLNSGQHLAAQKADPISESFKEHNCRSVRDYFRPMLSGGWWDCTDRAIADAPPSDRSYPRTWMHIHCRIPPQCSSLAQRYKQPSASTLSAEEFGS